MVTTCILDHPHLGQLTGRALRGDVEAYLGIPYGVISQRWTLAEPAAESSKASLAAFRLGPTCPQPEGSGDGFGAPSSGEVFETPIEDELGCLNLNVVRPGKVFGRLPVFFWIHGGAFLTGSGWTESCAPGNLVRRSIEVGRPIIVVTINYRLGPFGFLHSSDLEEDGPPSSGNLGLHDQRLALGWVQRNISDFGGDPDKVTIAGQSSGAYAIHAQISCNTHLSGEKSHFSRAIIQSGPLAPRHIWSIKRLDRVWNRILSHAPVTKNRSSDTSLSQENGISKKAEAQQRVEKMRNLPAKELTRLSLAEVGTWGVLDDRLFVSPELYNPDWSFRHDAQPRAEGIMIGDCADERNVFLGRIASRGLPPVKAALDSEVSVEDREDILASYQVGDEADGPLTQDGITSLSYLAQDLRYLYPTDELTRAWPFALRFHFSIPNRISKSPSLAGLAHHGTDTIYLFRNYNEVFEERGYCVERKMSDDVCEIWLDFMYGKEPFGRSEGAHFAKEGLRIIAREDVRSNPTVKARLDRWRELGIVRVGKIANLWISEQNDDDEFMY